MCSKTFVVISVCGNTPTTSLIEILNRQLKLFCTWSSDMQPFLPSRCHPHSTPAQCIIKAFNDLTSLSLSSLMPGPTPQVTQNSLKVSKDTTLIHTHLCTFWPIYQHVKIPTFPLQLTNTQCFMLYLTTYFYPFLEQFRFLLLCFQLLYNAFITRYCSYIYMLNLLTKIN